ncbi:MAG TPA: [protein-PII] uridylyltransferase [Burkholderiaceae bacterium]|nr:[protein-PII] uridylyltransferase [Burkholderiaceae bacterium]
MNDPGFALRGELNAQRAQVIGEFQTTGSVQRLLSRLSRVADRFVRRAAEQTRVSRFAAVVAVGGYGRSELFPHSDVDLLIIPAHNPTAAQAANIESFVHMLWDMGLPIGHAVRTVEQCGQEASRDPTVMTSTLESRIVCGVRAPFAALRSELNRVLDPRAFLNAKLLEQKQRHAKFEDTPFALEPNCKESPGGLRDLQILLWLSQAGGLGRSWSDLERGGLLTREETATLRRTERTLKSIRARVHLVAGRREDRLLFDVQHAVADSLGLRGTATRLASELLMQTYYRAAKNATQVNTIVLLAIEHRLAPRDPTPATVLDSVFFSRDELLDVADVGALQREPTAILRAFLLLQRHPELKGMSPGLLRAIWHAGASMGAAFRGDPANRQCFLSILQQPRGVVHELRRMNQWSVLGAYLPVFRRIVGQMQHDLFHVYTVDQHILMVVRNLRRFTQSQFAHEYPLCSQLVADFARPWLLYIAALFHDIAKGRGGDHSQHGSGDARRFCRQHGIGDEDTELVVFLVRHHLTMSQVAQKQDLTDPAVIGRFVQLVGTDRRLVALYLLTVADIRGTSPRVWSPWKARLLETLFNLTRRALGGEAQAADAELEGRKREALRILRLYGLSERAHEPLWRELDIVYFLRHSAQDIAWHARALLVHVGTERPIVRARLAPAGEGIEVLLYARDQKDLFARACGYFDSRSLSILDAKIHTTRRGYALDTFLVSERGHGTHFRSLLDRVEAELTEWMAARVELPPPLKGRLSRHSRHFPVSPAVQLNADESGQHYLLSLVATDRIGLLYAVARVLARHEVNVQTAKILTLGERVEDVFLIDGPALSQPKLQLQLERDLLEALTP